MPTFRCNSGSRLFSRLCPETLAVSCVVGISTRSKEALKEARFLKSVEEDESRGSGKIFTVDSDSTPSVAEPKPDIQQIVEACMKQMQAHQARTERSERPRSSRRKLRCWCCGEEGHTLRECSVIQQNKAAYFKQPADNKAEN